MNGTGNISPTTKLMTPLYHMDPYLSAIKVGFTLIGIPMNLLVAGNIIFTRQLRATQNIVWLGCGFSNVSMLFCFLVEVAAALVENSSFLLLLYQVIIGLPDAYQVLYLLLSWLDRHLFFTHTSFYKKYITNLVILVIQLTSFVLVTLLIKGRFLYQSLTHSFQLNSLTEKDVAILVTSVLMGICLMYVPIQELLEKRSYHKKQKQSMPPKNSKLIESETETAHCFTMSGDSENCQDKASNALPACLLLEPSGDRKNTIEDNHVCENNQSKFQENNIIDDKLTHSSTNLESSLTHLKQSDENCDPSNPPEKTFLSNSSENHQQNSSELLLQSFYSIKMNIKAFIIFMMFPVLFMVLSLFCLLFCFIYGSLFDTCSSWFATSFYLHGVCMGFYTAMFNPLCFVGHSHDFVVLEQRCNPTGGIARMTRRLIDCWFNNRNASPSTHHDAVAAMI